MKIYVWEGEEVSPGLSGGTLVVAANNLPQALEFITIEVNKRIKHQEKWAAATKKYFEEHPSNKKWDREAWTKFLDSFPKPDYIEIYKVPEIPPTRTIISPGIVAYNDGGFE